MTHLTEKLDSSGLGVVGSFDWLDLVSGLLEEHSYFKRHLFRWPLLNNHGEARAHWGSFLSPFAEQIYHLDLYIFAECHIVNLWNFPHPQEHLLLCLAFTVWLLSFADSNISEFHPMSPPPPFHVTWLSLGLWFRLETSKNVVGVYVFLLPLSNGLFWKWSLPFWFIYSQIHLPELSAGCIRRSKRQKQNKTKQPQSFVG